MNSVKVIFSSWRGKSVYLPQLSWNMENVNLKNLLVAVSV